MSCKLPARLSFAQAKEGGIEAVIHAMLELFGADETDAVLLADASNAFNRIKRVTAMHNIRFICPPIAISILNFYRAATRLFVAGGFEFASREGTTQGCPLAMAMYAVSSMPLVQLLRPRNKRGPDDTAGDEVKEGGAPDAVQAWYADDAQAAGKLEALHRWWTTLNKHGPKYGWYPKAVKSFLVVKHGLLERAQKMFSGTGIQVVDGGKRDLGAAIGTELFVTKFLQKKVAKWIDEMGTLSKIAITQPHAAHVVFVHGVRSKWNFSQRTMQWWRT